MGHCGQELVRLLRSGIGLVDVRIEFDCNPAVVSRSGDLRQGGSKIDRPVARDQVLVLARRPDVLEMLVPRVRTHPSGPV